MLDISKHPCFNDSARHKFARIHLPVAPKCNIQCNYCNRKYDCLNESRPGVTSTLLSPIQALEYLNKAMIKNPNIKVVGIAGPGDPFATPDETLETLRLVRQTYPEMLLCVATNGLNVAGYAEQLANLMVSHVTITINTVSPTIGSLIYSWVRNGNLIYRGKLGAKILIKNQLKAIKILCEKGITVKINSIIVPGINDTHIKDVARRAALGGATILNAIPLYPTEDTVFEPIPEPDEKTVKKIRKSAGRFIKQMHHCTRCRADAVGILGQDDQEILSILHEMNNPVLSTSKKKPYVAVASMEGHLINQHLGEARELWIYGKIDASINLLEKRKLPGLGGGMQRWQQVAAAINDCSYLLVSGIGANPSKVIGDSGITVIETEGFINTSLEYLFGNQSGRLMPKIKPAKCGESCAGNGLGCC
ncbi:MAG: nitrogen fixation protein NifB [Candidatus Margulisiibacteriota bacterium]|nr:MAG: nitrogen fixation protein NifB [Candidatus Margulisbacteria bacterium GWE2_39_32]PZM79510.1 MAG: nitrogen fixation protein NifB [Candidatus Margulisiibacteriota bacterium]HCT83612.1 nitrogen fixation protein NifB [Candidatus Margulisiibacteriota bacterium]HCY37815.1 nitrogen fixation protein NifB [Candidatus Margulisiibacteriota bacterium]